jgi:hypothetical protein
MMTNRKTLSAAASAGVKDVPAVPRAPVDRTAAHRQARLRARLGAPVQAFLDPERRRRLDQFAATRQMTIADVLRDALRSYFEQQPAQPPKPARGRARTKVVE